MVSTRRLLVNAKTGREEYVDVDLELRQAASLLEGRDIAKEFDDLVVLLRSKGVVWKWLSGSAFSRNVHGGSGAKMTLSDEERAQFHTRIKVEGTIDKRVFEEFKGIYELEVEKAEVEDKAQPSVSHVLEMLLRKGIRAYKAESKH